MLAAEHLSWGPARRKRTDLGKLKPRRLNEEKLAFLREAYEPDEEHLVAEALFDLATAFGEEGAPPAQQHTSPPVNGKRTRKATAVAALSAQQQQEAQASHHTHKHAARSYTQQRAAPLPHNNGYAAPSASALEQQSLLVAQLQQQQQQAQRQQQQQQQAQQQQAHASPRAPLQAGSYPPPQHLYAGGLPGNPYIMPPYPSPMQLPPGALSGKLATTLLPNGSPVPLAFGPNGTLMPLAGGWPHSLLHPQQQQQQQQQQQRQPQHPASTLAQQLQPQLGLSGQALTGGAAGLPAGLGLPLGATPAHALLAQQQQAQQLLQQIPGIKLEGQHAINGAAAQPLLASQQQGMQGNGVHAVCEGVKAEQQGSGPSNGHHPSCLKRCALHVRIAHMIMERQRQQAGAASGAAVHTDTNTHPHEQAGEAGAQPQQPCPSSPPSGNHQNHTNEQQQNGLVRQHSAGSTSTCPSAPSTLADTNTSPASARTPQQQPQPQPQQQAAGGSPCPGQEQQQQQANKGPPASPAAQDAPAPALGRPQQAMPAPAAPPSLASILGAGSIPGHALQQQQQQLLQLQRLQQLQQLVNVSAAFPFSPFGQAGLPGLSQAPLTSPYLSSLAAATPGLPTSAAAATAPHLPTTSYGIPAAALLGLNGLQQHMYAQLPTSTGLPHAGAPQQPPQQSSGPGFAGSSALGAGLAGLPQSTGLPPQLLAQMVGGSAGLGAGLGLPGLMSLGGQQYGLPAFAGSLPLASQALQLQQQAGQQQQQPGQQRPLGPAAAPGLQALNKQTAQGPQVH